MPKYWQKYDIDMLQIQSSQGLCWCLSATLPLKPISMSMGRATAAWNDGDVRGPCCHHGPGLHEWPFQAPEPMLMYIAYTACCHGMCLGPWYHYNWVSYWCPCSVLPPETMIADIGETCWLQGPYEGGSSVPLPETMWIFMIHATTDYKGK